MGKAVGLTMFSLNDYGEAELEIGHYMVFYNEERNYQGLNNLTPDEAYFGRQRYAA